MSFLRVWYPVCVLFCIHSLNILIEQSNLIAYKWSDLNVEKEPVYLLGCCSLGDLSLNKTTYDLQQLRKVLLDRFENKPNPHHKDFDYYDYGTSRKKIFENGKKFALNRTAAGGYLILHEMFCLIVHSGLELVRLSEFLSPLIMFGFKRDSLDLAKIDHPEDHFSQSIVINAHCSKNYFRFRCLNDCYKTRFRFSGYFFGGNETGSIHLNQSKNQTVKKHERYCVTRCRRDACKMVHLAKSEDDNSRAKKFTVRAVLSAFDFWSQLIGLVCSFAGVSLYQLLSIFIKFICRKWRGTRVKNLLTYLKRSFLLLAQLHYAYLFVKVFLKYKNSLANSETKEITTLLRRPELINMLVCVSVDMILARDYKRNEQRRVYFNMTLLEIEKETDRGLDDVLEGVYPDERSRPIPVEWMITTKILFIKHPWFKRCFQLIVDPAELRKYPMPFSKLKIKFKRLGENSNNPYDVYLLPDGNAPFSGKGIQFGLNAFKKYIIRRSKWNKKVKCVDYERWYARFKCTNRENCLEHCVHRKFIERHNAVTFGIFYFASVTDRDLFDDAEWSGSRLVENETAFMAVLNECSDEIPEGKACMESYLQSIAKIEQHSRYTVEVDLNYEVTSRVDEEPSEYKLTLDLLNLQGIFFGLSVPELLQAIYSFVRIKLIKLKIMKITKITKETTNKMVLLLTYLLCLAGFTWHVRYTLITILNGELTYEEHYEIIERVRMPNEITFCLSFNTSSIDKNHKLTGTYLERLTEEMTAERVFKSIAHLKESYEWLGLDLGLVKTFYQTDKKCFRIKIDQQYDRGRFRFSSETQALHINFNRTFIGKRPVYFMTKEKNGMAFSKMIRLDLGYQFKSFKKYSMSHELFVIRHDERFNPFKKSISPLYQSDPNEIKEESTSNGLKSLYLPVERIDFDHELTDDLFEQQHYQMRNEISPMADSIHEQEFSINHPSIKLSFTKGYTRPVKNTYGPDFTLNFVHLKKVLVISDEDTYTTHSLSLLNMLSIWFGLSVLDLHLLFSDRPLTTFLSLRLLPRIGLVFVLFCKWLLKFEYSLSKHLDSY